MSEVVKFNSGDNLIFTSSSLKVFNDSFQINFSDGDFLDALSISGCDSDLVNRFRYERSIYQSNIYVSRYFFDFLNSNNFDIENESYFIDFFSSCALLSVSGLDKLRREDQAFSTFSKLLKKPEFASFIEKFYLHILNLPRLYSQVLNDNLKKNSSFTLSVISHRDIFNWENPESIKTFYSQLSENFANNIEAYFENNHSFFVFQDKVFDLFSVIEGMPEFSLDDDFAGCMFDFIKLSSPIILYNLKGKDFLIYIAQLSYKERHSIEFFGAKEEHGDREITLSVRLFNDPSVCLGFNSHDILKISEILFKDQFKDSALFRICSSFQVNSQIDDYFSNFQCFLEGEQFSRKDFYSYFIFMKNPTIYSSGSFAMAHKSSPDPEKFVRFFQAFHNYIKLFPKFYGDLKPISGDGNFFIDEESVSNKLIAISGDDLELLKSRFHYFFNQDFEFYYNRTRIRFKKTRFIEDIIQGVNDLPSFDLNDSDFCERFLKLISDADSLFNYTYVFSNFIDDIVEDIVDD